MTKEMSSRYCTLIKFSRGGHFIAAVNGSNIQIFNTFTGALVCTLRGHNNKIRNLVWLDYDARLMSVGSEGCVYFWDLFPANKRPEQYMSQAPFLAGTGPSNGSKSYIVSTERTVKEVFFTKMIDPSTGLECSIKEPRDVELGRHVSAMLMDEARNFLLLGTADEEVPNAIVVAPIMNQILGNPLEANHIHTGLITAMCMSYDGSMIFSADSNGCLCISE